MKQIIPFKKELPFKTKVSEITSISLERELEVLDDGIVSGVFHITGDYKMNEGSINREKYSFDLPFDITLDPRYDINTVNADIEDFYYDVINEDTLKVNIDLFIEAEYLPEEPKVVEEVDVTEEETDDMRTNEEEREDIVEEDIKEDIPQVEEVKVTEVNDVQDRDDTVDIGKDLFSNLDNTETYTTYYVYIVKDDDTVEKILTKYDIAKEDFENYNDINNIKAGDKVIIPKKCE
ncbi:MAG: LysM peptidoglycan-binding domain-containing protein [Bacilli bacterium]